jgi:MmeI, target recognition domain
MLTAIRPLSRYIALSIVAIIDRPSIYAFVSPDIWPAASLQVFAFEDDYSFGILTSSIHRAWFEARATRMRRDLRYTPDTVFDSFPLPQAPTDEAVGELVSAVEDLLVYRDGRVAEGIPLGRLYATLREPGRNELRRRHERIDDAVFGLYGFDRSEDLLAQVMALNESIAEEEAGEIAAPRGRGRSA